MLKKENASGGVWIGLFRFGDLLGRRGLLVRSAGGVKSEMGRMP